MKFMSKFTIFGWHHSYTSLSPCSRGYSPVGDNDTASKLHKLLGLPSMPTTPTLQTIQTFQWIDSSLCIFWNWWKGIIPGLYPSVSRNQMCWYCLLDQYFHPLHNCICSGDLKVGIKLENTCSQKGSIYSSNLWVMSPHQVPNPKVMIMAEAKERKHKKALPTASTNADKKELQ